jgi:hypothetical protein
MTLRQLEGCITGEFQKTQNLSQVDYGMLVGDCRRNMVGSLPRGIPTVVDERQGACEMG